MNETQERLLARGVIVLPQDIEHDTYQYVLEALLTRPGPVRLYCAGDGGDSGSAFAIADLIREHGQVIGLLPGSAASNHVTVFAACGQRYVYPMGRIGVHKVAWANVNGRTDSQSLWVNAAAFEATERSIAALLASASRLDAEWWFNKMQAAGSGGVVEFDADYIVKLGLARPVQEFQRAEMRQQVQALHTHNGSDNGVSEG